MKTVLAAWRQDTLGQCCNIFKRKAVDGSFNLAFIWTASIIIMLLLTSSSFAFAWCFAFGPRCLLRSCCRSLRRNLFFSISTFLCIILIVVIASFNLVKNIISRIVSLPFLCFLLVVLFGGLVLLCFLLRLFLMLAIFLFPIFFIFL